LLESYESTLDEVAMSENRTVLEASTKTVRVCMFASHTYLCGSHIIVRLTHHTSDSYTFVTFLGLVGLASAAEAPPPAGASEERDLNCGALTDGAEKALPLLRGNISICDFSVSALSPALVTFCAVWALSRFTSFALPLPWCASGRAYQSV
jgi:hypothetical protein